MTKLLHVSASPRGPSSDGLTLTDAFLDRYRFTDVTEIHGQPTVPTATRDAD